MRSAPIAALCAALLLTLPTAVCAQIDTDAGVGPAVEERDWRLPFRNPNKPIDPPRAAWEELGKMLGRAKLPEAVTRFDERGIEVCDDQSWLNSFATLQAMNAQTFDIGYLSQIIRESGVPKDREIALYGMFFHPDPGVVMQMLNHIPGEPSRRLREEGYRRAIEFMRVHYGQKNPGELEEWKKIRVGPGGTMPPKPGEWSHSFDAIPYFMLLQVDSPIDQRQALWFLGEVVKIRPELWKKYLQAAVLQLYSLVTHDDRTVREAAVAFLSELDPESRPAPDVDDGKAKLHAWIDAIAYDVFPPIRPVSPGLTELYPSEEVRTMVQLGKTLLEDGSLGAPATGKLKKTGQLYRGLRIAKTPTPLDKLGIPVDSVITSVNGQPIASCKDALRVLSALSSVKSYFIEYVIDNEPHAKEFKRGA